MDLGGGSIGLVKPPSFTGSHLHCLQYPKKNTEYGASSVPDFKYFPVDILCQFMLGLSKVYAKKSDNCVSNVPDPLDSRH